MSDWTLHLGDSLAADGGLATLGDRSVDVVLCDPPYEAEAHTLQRRTKTDARAGTWKHGADTRRVVEMPIPFAPITEYERGYFADEASRVARRWVIAFCQAEAVAAWKDAFEEAGLAHRRACVWVKPDAQPQLSGDRPGMGYESIVCAHVIGPSRWNGGGRVGVYTFNKNASNQGEPRYHPTQKPLALMERLVADFTEPGELVLDPFAGSATTGVACLRLGRRFLGWEREPGYHASAMARLRAAEAQGSFFVPAPKQHGLGFTTGEAPQALSNSSNSGRAAKPEEAA